MTILKKVVVALILIVVALAVVGLLLPRRAHVERSALVDAPRATIFAQLNGFRNFHKWSPWADKDPNAKYTFAGPDFGVGAKMSWSGDPKTVGSGSQEIVESRPYERVTTDLDFGPQGKGTAAFTLASEGSGTRVTWAFETDLGMNPVSHYLGLMFDRMIGPDYERGLVRLKTLAESLPRTDFSDLQFELVDVSPVTVAWLSASSGQGEKAIAAAIGSAYAQIGRFLAAKHLKQAGPPLTINTKWADDIYEFEAAIPLDRIPERAVPAGSPVKVRQSYAGKAVKVVHRGAYRDLPVTYDKLHAYVAAYDLEAAGADWDEYVSDPGSTPEAELVTNIFMPVK
jgi:effector-binding domain-containing protein/carbon monoxide dehydrogenase subunit G